MINNIEGEFYNQVILEISVPDIADVSAVNYTAKQFDKYGVENSASTTNKQRPFVVCHPEAVTLKVETWLGKTITWKFMAGYNPLPLKRIYTDDANVVTETDVAVTSIQIGY